VRTDERNHQTFSYLVNRSKNTLKTKPMRKLQTVIIHEVLELGFVFFFFFMETFETGNLWVAA